MAVGSELPISANSFSYGFLYTPEHIQLQQTVCCETHVYRNDSKRDASSRSSDFHPEIATALVSPHHIRGCTTQNLVSSCGSPLRLFAFVSRIRQVHAGRAYTFASTSVYIYMNMLAVYGNCENEKYSSIAVWSDGGGIHGVYMPAKILLSLISGDRVFVHWYVRLSVCVCVCVQDSVLRHRQEYRLQCGYASST